MLAGLGAARGTAEESTFRRAFAVGGKAPRLVAALATIDALHAQHDTAQVIPPARRTT